MNPVKRVPLDFAHPLRTPWPGYQNPYDVPCPEKGKTCFGGVSKDRAWLDAFARMLALAGSTRMNREAVHPVLREMYCAPEFAPGEGFADFVEKLTHKEREDYPSDYAVALGLLRAAKLPEKWGWCPVCNASMHDPAFEAQREAWTPTEPPTGPGYQLWSGGYDNAPEATTPVFATVEELVAYTQKTGVFRARDGADFIEFEITMHAQATDGASDGLTWRFPVSMGSAEEIDLHYLRRWILARRSASGAWTWLVKDTGAAGFAASLLGAATAGMAAVRTMKTEDAT